MGRQAAMTKMGAKVTRRVRGRGGNIKIRGLRLSEGNFAWGSEQITKKSRILDVVYNATNNELVRTKTLTKNTIVQIDGTPFKQFYTQKYDVDLGKKKVAAKLTEEEKAAQEAPKKKSKHVLAVIKKRQTGRFLDSHVAE